MSFNTAFLFQRTHRGKGKSDYFEGLGLPGAKEVGEISFDDACSSSLAGKALAVVGDWTVVVDPTGFTEVANHPSVKQPGLFPVAVESRLLSDTRNSLVLGALMFGASGSYGFTFLADGSRKRLVLKVDGAMVWDIGSSLFPSDRFSPEQGGEGSVFGVIVEATGLTLADLEAARYLLFEFDEKYIKWVHD